MGSTKAHIKDTIEKLRELGCEVHTPGRGDHYRVTYNGTFVGAVGSSPHTINGLAHSIRKIRQRIERLRTTGLTF